jgi:hypothetical protein
MATAVYILCALTSLACAALLLAAYRRNPRTRLLFWSFLCFAWLAVNNVLLVIDLVLVTDIDLAVPRQATALIGLVVLLCGLILESGEGGRA